jgi:hypothetical protein
MKVISTNRVQPKYEETEYKSKPVMSDKVRPRIIEEAWPPKPAKGPFINTSNLEAFKKEQEGRRKAWAEFKKAEASKKRLSPVGETALPSKTSKKRGRPKKIK